MARKILLKWILCMLILFGADALSGCAKEDAAKQEESLPNASVTKQTEEGKSGLRELKAETVDYSVEFGGISGCMVIYDPAENTYFYYNREMCETRVSPLSTFKIVSAVIGLDEDVIEDNTSVMEYNGTKYPIAEWNDNLSLDKAFRSSCIWYFRQVIDKAGREKVQEELDELNYGNCDISEWEGSNVNSLPELNGFWLESSLEISPLEQVEVLYRLFEGKTSYADNDLKILKNMMSVSDEDGKTIYGKTGSGQEGKAWFVGFSEDNGQRVYFALYMNDSANAERISGNYAKEVALAVMEKYDNSAAEGRTEEYGAEKVYPIADYGAFEECGQEYCTDAGMPYYSYTVDCFYFEERVPAVVNETLQQIWKEKEAEYQKTARLYSGEEASGDGGVSLVPYDYYHILGIRYVGEDYVSLLYNDISYMGGAHPYSWFDGITIDVRSGEQVSAGEILGRPDQEILKQVSEEMGADTQLTWEDLDFYLTDSSVVFLQHYYPAGYSGDVAWPREKDMSDRQMQVLMEERAGYYQKSGYYQDIVNYWENVREVRDVANIMEPLYSTDQKYYSEEDFQNEPDFVIHLAKNEIYARHGYIFKDPDLYNYFMGCLWYEPLVSGEEFDVSVFNEYEKKNLEVLARLDQL